jgi:hypothetical protein
MLSPDNGEFHFNIDLDGNFTNAPDTVGTESLAVTGNGTDTLVIGQVIPTTPTITITNNLDAN